MTCRYCESGYTLTADGMHHSEVGFVGRCEADQGTETKLRAIAEAMRPFMSQAEDGQWIVMSAYKHGDTLAEITVQVAEHDPLRQEHDDEH